MKIIELELLSDDLKATEKFYKNVLGLHPYTSGNGILSFKIGYTKLIFRKSNNLRPVYHFAIDLPGNRFFDSHNFIKGNTAIVPVEPGNDIANFTAWDAKSFYFLDNNGNIIEFITRYPNRAYDVEPFSSNSYIAISEIGLVTKNVPELADRLVKEFGIPIYPRQPRGDKFTVVGDDEGLFIIGEKGRDWYPTKVQSLSFRTRVVFMDKGCVWHILR